MEGLRSTPEIGKITEKFTYARTEPPKIPT